MNMILTPKAKRTEPITRLDDNAMIDFDTIAHGMGITRDEAITRIVRQMEWRVMALKSEVDALTKGVNA